MNWRNAERVLIMLIRRKQSSAEPGSSINISASLVSFIQTPKSHAMPLSDEVRKESNSESGIARSVVTVVVTLLLYTPHTRRQLFSLLYLPILTLTMFEKSRFLPLIQQVQLLHLMTKSQYTKFWRFPYEPSNNMHYHLMPFPSPALTRILCTEESPC